MRHVCPLDNICQASHSAAREAPSPPQPRLLVLSLIPSFEVCQHSYILGDTSERKLFVTFLLDVGKIESFVITSYRLSYISAVFLLPKLNIRYFLTSGDI